VLLWGADFSKLQHVEAVRRADATGALDDAGPQVWDDLRRVTVLMTTVFAAMIVIFHTMIARYLGKAEVRAAFGRPAPPKHEAPPLPGGDSTR
jgi:hypothetical protein